MEDVALLADFIPKDRMEGWSPVLQQGDMWQISVENIDLQPHNGLQDNSTTVLEVNVRGVEVLIRLEVGVRVELSDKSRVSLIEVREGDVLR